MAHLVQVYRPRDLSKDDIKACLALIKEGDAVDVRYAAQYLPRAEFIAIVRDGDEIVGVGAIKGQRPNYAARRARLSGFQFDPNTNELGYISVKASHQGRGISKDITTKLLSASEGRPLFATASNPRMERTLEGAGFDQRLWIRGQFSCRVGPASLGVSLMPKLLIRSRAERRN